ncbi:MAG: hypothetical protein JST75_21720 [Bacteroidetes bacterium]|nr:hypothetical protein [Bacteroidota bacterium]
MRYFLRRKTRGQEQTLRSARSTGIIILAIISLLLNAAGKTYAYPHTLPVKRVTSTVIPTRAAGMASGYAIGQDSTKPVSEEMKGKVSKEEFKQKALAKIKEFQNCLVILCDKKAGNEALDNAVDQATSLFIDGAIIEVSSVHSDEKKHLKVRDFLEKLRTLRYERVVITFSHVDYVSNIRKGSDGKYYGVVSFEQIFRAFSDGRLVYEDETKKTTEVQLVVYERNLRGNAVQQWDVMLSDVEVLGTKTPKQ